MNDTCKAWDGKEVIKVPDNQCEAIRLFADSQPQYIWDGNLRAFETLAPPAGGWPKSLSEYYKVGELVRLINKRYDDELTEQFPDWKDWEVLPPVG